MPNDRVAVNTQAVADAKLAALAEEFIEAADARMRTIRNQHAEITEANANRARYIAARAALIEALEEGKQT